MTQAEIAKSLKNKVGFYQSLILDVRKGSYGKTQKLIMTERFKGQIIGLRAAIELLNK